MTTIKIIDIKVNDTTEQEALEFIKKGLTRKGKKYKIFTPNPEIIVFANKDDDFKRVLNSADLALPDGMGLLWAAKMLGKQLQNRIAGVDFMELLCEEASKRGFTVGFMGGGPKIAERTAECLWRKYPSLKIVFAAEEWPVSWLRLPQNGSSNGAEVARAGPGARQPHAFPTSLTRLGPPRGAPHALASPASGSPRQSIDILFVALGYPKQEYWIYENLPKIPVRVAIAVGGSFDYISGEVPRAPLFMRTLGFEWLFRLIIQPWRVHRQLALIQFILLVLKEWLSENE